jgi:hypothetical protein
MATEKEIVYNILNIHSGGKLSDDFIPSYNQIAFMVKYVRSLLIRRDANENWDINPDYFQDLGCLKLIKVDKAECCEIDLDCDVLRTEIKLPKPIRLKTKVAIIVNAVDKQTTLDVILPQRSPYIKYSKYTSSIPRVYYLNGYLYVPNTLELSYLNVRAIIENPEEANSFLCDGEACYTTDSNYPLPVDMIQPLTEIILSKEMNYMLKTAPDETNNSQSNRNI